MCKIFSPQLMQLLKARVFVNAMLFQACLLFVNKAGAYSQILDSSLKMASGTNTLAFLKQLQLRRKGFEASSLVQISENGNLKNRYL
jgi:hypothetical protein